MTDITLKSTVKLPFCKHQSNAEVIYAVGFLAHSQNENGIYTYRYNLSKAIAKKTYYYIIRSVT